MAKNDTRAADSPETAENSSSRLTGAFLAVAALTTVVGFATFFSAWLKASIDPGKATLDIAAKQFALAHYLIAADLAEQSVLPAEGADDLQMLREYLIGAGMASEAMLDADVKRRRSAIYDALPHLKSASSAWPAGRADEGDRLLALSLFEIGNFTEAVPPLNRCIDRNPTTRDELIPILAQCYLRGGSNDAALAIEALDKLDQQRVLTPASNAEIQCLRAQSLLQLGKFDQARTLLAQVNDELTKLMLSDSASLAAVNAKVNLLSAVADISEALLRFGKAITTGTESREEVSRFLAPAMQKLSLLQRDGSPEIINQANLWAARANACYGQPQESLNLFTNVRQQQPFEGTNIAAGIEEIEILAAEGNGEEMLQTVRYLLREIGNEKNFDSTEIDLESFRSRLIAALQVLRSKEKFSHCVAIAKTLPTLFPLADASYEEAITHRQQAEGVMASATRSTQDISPDTLLIAKKKYRAAADAFNQAAKLRFDTVEYCDTLWQAIEAYQNSGQFQISVELLDDYLRYEDRRRQPRALLALGRARLATGDSAGSLNALQECIVEFPRDPLRYDARLYAALAHAENEDFADARVLLDENLTDGGLTPESNIWRDSLFSLGELLFRQGNQVHLRWSLDEPQRDQSKPRPTEELRQLQPIIEEAIVKLSEASLRYWPAPRAKHAAYLNARAHKVAAVWPKLESESADALDAAKRQLRQQSDQHLIAALEGFVNLRKELATREEEQTLSTAQQAMLRNCYIAEADTLFELGRYDQAAEAFRAVSLRYLNEPPALEALLGQSKCLRQLNRPREARLVIRQAIVVLGRIPPEADPMFTSTTRYDRKRWQELLAWLDTGPMPEDTDA